MTAEPKRTPQQERMASCNQQAGAKALKGDERSKFMSSCLKGDASAASSPQRTPQQERMASCNQQAGAKAMKGDGRSEFMSACLKG